MNHNCAEYHIPAHADVSDIQVIFVDRPDPEVRPPGAKGVGEIGIVGTAAAIASAIFRQADRLNAADAGGSPGRRKAGL